MRQIALQIVLCAKYFKNFLARLKKRFADWFFSNLPTVSSCCAMPPKACAMGILFLKMTCANRKLER
ncbi:MAG: hypothetical protein DBX55_04970 [Verrucomicrobia bacterium]|nr:MAG: hypothetical protein DBX55_04970 [Verrucomicrobiota bacterium]